MDHTAVSNDPLIWPPIHQPEAIALLRERDLECLRPGCGCTEWWI